MICAPPSFAARLRELFLQRKYGDLSLAGFARRLILAFILCYFPLGTAALISDLLTESEQYAAILLSADAFSGRDPWAPPFAFLGSYPAWTFYFNARNLKTDYIFSATRQDFFDVLRDERYQSIVLVGHGSFNNWRATDGEISNLDIERQSGKFCRKRGEWFQLTCPAPDFSPIHLGELVMDRDKVYHYHGEKAGNIDFVWDALLGFSHIKAETAKSRAARSSSPHSGS